MDKKKAFFLLRILFVITLFGCSFAFLYKRLNLGGITFPTMEVRNDCVKKEGTKDFDCKREFNVETYIKKNGIDEVINTISQNQNSIEKLAI